MVTNICKLRDVLPSSYHNNTRVVYTSSKKGRFGKRVSWECKLFRHKCLQEGGDRSTTERPASDELQQELHFLRFNFKILDRFSNYEIHTVRHHNALFLKQWCVFSQITWDITIGFLAGPRASTQYISPFFRGNLGQNSGSVLWLTKKAHSF